MHDYVVYILRCNDGSLYTGVTRDLAHRFYQHETGLHRTCYTFRRRPLALVYAVHFHDIHEAIHWEKQVKRWSRKKKEALIAGDQKKLEEYAVCKNETHCSNKPTLSSRAPSLPAGRETRDDKE